MKSLKLKAMIAVLAIAMAGLTAVAKPASTMASDLEDLIVVNGLFTDYNAEDLAGLIAVDEVVGGGGVGGSGDLADLIFVSGLFTGWDAEELAGLIAVDDIVGGGF